MKLKTAPVKVEPVVVVILTLLYAPQGVEPVVQGVPALASKMNDPLAVPPSLNTTLFKLHRTGLALALAARHSRAPTPATPFKYNFTALILL